MTFFNINNAKGFISLRSYNNINNAKGFISLRSYTDFGFWRSYFSFIGPIDFIDFIDFIGHIDLIRSHRISLDSNEANNLHQDLFSV